jgi:succinate-acetate transporter protein
MASAVRQPSIKRGIYFLCWAIFTGLLFLAALRTNVALLVVLGLLFLTIAEVTGGNSVTTQIGGWLGIATALVTWYAALADMHSSLCSRCIRVAGGPYWLSYQVLLVASGKFTQSGGVGISRSNLEFFAFLKNYYR